jgi:fatty-acyl-CoA synthase
VTYSDKGVISKIAVPQRVLFVQALAKTSVGKLDKKALRAQYAEGT